MSAMSAMSAMSGSRVARVPLADAGQDSFVLLKVISEGPEPLDVKIIGTDCADVYAGSIKQRQVSKLRASNYHGSAPEWEAALSKVLLQMPVDGEHKVSLEGLDIIATVSPEDLITLVFRKNIKGITQRLGTITLKYAEEEIELSEWAAIAAAATATAQEEIATLKTKFNDQQAAIDRLNQQLEELVRAKKEHETALLEKFRDLLNSKKRKIRDQERLLAKASGGDQSNLVTRGESPPEETSVVSRKAGPSRTSKRKASGKTVQRRHEDEDMDIDEPDSEEQQDGEEEDLLANAVTPEPSDMDETEDEHDLDAPTKRGVGLKAEPTTTASTQSRKSPELESAPPRRELPFARHRSRSKPVEEVQKPPPLDDEEETEDDEL